MALFGSFGGPSASEKIVAELVRRIMGYAVGATKSVVQEDSAAAIPVLLDHIFFNYQWVDRVAAKLLGAGRPAFMDPLREALMAEVKATVLSHLSSDQRQRAVDNLDQLLDGFMIEFAAYGAPTPDKPGPTGTLFYEFAKRVAAGSGHANEALIIAGAATNAAAGIKAIDAPALLLGLA
jgi:hypothetical protein